MQLFSEEVRRDLTDDLNRFVGEEAVVEYESPNGRKGNGMILKGTLIGVYRNGFLIDGGSIGQRSFFSCSDLFAEHVKFISGPAAASVRMTVTRLRGDLFRLRPQRASRDLQAMLA